MKNPLRKLADAWRQWRLHRTLPLRLEFVVTDYCNLNCRGCTHYSPLAPKEFEPLERLAMSARHLGDVCGTAVDAVYLIGGETLLYPQLVPAMGILREAFPSSKINIFTNGIALPKMSDDFWDMVLKADVTISITRYPIRFDYDAVEELCRRHGVKYEVFADRDNPGTFFRFALDPEGRNNARLSHFKCFNFGCVSIVGNRLYPCSISACVEHLNKACGTTFEHQDGDYLEVDKIESAGQILELRNKPVPFCRYCPDRPEIVKYGTSKRALSEWVNDNV